MFPSRPRSRRPLSRVRAAVLAAVLSLTGLAAALTTSSAAAATPAARVAPAAVMAPAAGTTLSAPDLPSVGSLAVTGAQATVTVRKVYRTGQVHWINHVLDTRLTNLDGCKAERVGPSWRRSTYRSSIDLVCSDGPEQVRSAVRALVASRPWYRIKVTNVPLVGFSLLGPESLDGASGLGDAPGDALAQLPSGEFSFPEGDQISLSYVGRGVTQAQLQAAVAAFAKALKISADQVKVGPLF